MNKLFLKQQEFTSFSKKKSRKKKKVGIILKTENWLKRKEGKCERFESWKFKKKYQGKEYTVILSQGKTKSFF